MGNANIISIAYVTAGILHRSSRSKESAQTHPSVDQAISDRVPQMIYLCR
jgi:hypothetical protein